jgi:hypothetical protein
MASASAASNEVQRVVCRQEQDDHVGVFYVISRSENLNSIDKTARGFSILQTGNGRYIGKKLQI